MKYNVHHLKFLPTVPSISIAPSSTILQKSTQPLSISPSKKKKKPPHPIPINPPKSPGIKTPPEAPPKMGFLSGLFAGLTLTTTTLYFSLTIHQRSRAHQAAILRHQTLLLDSLADPTLLRPNTDDELRPRYVLARGSWSERWKDRWNGDVEGAVRWAQGLRWRTVREEAEGRWRDWREGERRG